MLKSNHSDFDAVKARWVRGPIFRPAGVTVRSIEEEMLKKECIRDLIAERPLATKSLRTNTLGR